MVQSGMPPLIRFGILRARAIAGPPTGGAVPPSRGRPEIAARRALTYDNSRGSVLTQIQCRGPNVFLPLAMNPLSITAGTTEGPRRR